ncbi:unnamed protein product [Allacma fusca]|uniref:Uncharacterized protein n=1 Tax=Allacma fusca TaxID=39272 RepID=A0A8J2K7B2_9HEXA|nr:unnamed protein product [Allacma fusca]
MAPKCPVVAVTSAEADQPEESFVIRLLFEAAGPLLLILVLRILQYLTHKVAPGSCLERLMATVDFSPRFMNTLSTMQHEIPSLEFPLALRRHSGSMVVSWQMCRQLMSVSQKFVCIRNYIHNL